LGFGGCRKIFNYRLDALPVIYISSVTPVSLTVLMAIFPGGPVLASTQMSPFWILLEIMVMEVVVTTGPIRRAKLQSNRYHQQTNSQLLQAGCPSYRSANSVKAPKEKLSFTLCKR